MEEIGIYYGALRNFKTALIRGYLKETQGNVCEAARLLGVHRNTLDRLTAELEIDAHEFRSMRRKNVPAVRVKARCPDCESPRYKSSVMGADMVRCRDCYKLYALAVPRVSEAA